MDDLIKEAIEFIRAHEPPEGYFVGFSGGKDSLVIDKLVKISGVKYRSFYNVTTIDAPEVVRFIRDKHPDVTFLKPELTFWQWVDKKGVPTRGQRWCCEKLKHGAKSNKLQPGYRFFLAGIRAEESFARKESGCISLNPKTHVTTYKPIFEWSSSEVWEFINHYGLEYCSLYDEGFGRIGCIVCPMLTKRKAKESRERWPGMHRVLDIHLNKLWDIHKVKLIGSNFTYEEFMAWPNWKTKEQRKQLNLY